MSCRKFAENSASETSDAGSLRKERGASASGSRDFKRLAHSNAISYALQSRNWATRQNFLQAFSQRAGLSERASSMYSNIYRRFLARSTTSVSTLSLPQM